MNLVLVAVAKNTSNVMENYRSNSSSDSVHVAVGVIFNPQKQVLVALRPIDADQGGLWEFPGGKIEPNENSLQALCRELKEEIGIDVITAKPLVQFSHDYKKYRVTLHAWIVAEFSGEPIGLQDQPLQWVSISELSCLKFPNANQQIINKLGAVD